MTTAEFNNVVLPGTDISHIIFKGDICKRNEKTIGPGLKTMDNKIIVCNSGVLRCKDDKYFWVEYYKKKYIPTKDDVVVGIVSSKTSEVYKVDIGAAELATLPNLAFTNVTKKNRPDLKVGNVLAAKVKIATPYMESSISCVEYANSLILGQLENGFVITVSVNYALKLKKSSSSLLFSLGQFVPYEIVVGANGKIWINSGSIRATIAIGSAIVNAEYLEEEDIQNLVKRFNKSLNNLH
ncbi:Nucleic acid-binding, OB-fold,K Homology domain, type 1 [Cinara cedri]|uniref:Nucleic acid-binding, OB-fold,K Homology domain, type 1 n=1 Tax=Cinara cedri TaxID=506608 RepID=A0A5E4NMG8_9HEMI|nr:Nucleic acid-binding, OB-fold,K Homology domain, type 1 [Cinara cedri]